MRLILRPVSMILPDTRLCVLLSEDSHGPLPLCLTLDTGVTPPGRYTLVRGKHQLVVGVPFITFEVIKVVGHSGILLHVGNRRRDTRNCFLLGQRFGAIGGEVAVLDSQVAFKAFIQAYGIYENIPLVIEPYVPASSLH